MRAIKLLLGLFALSALQGWNANAQAPGTFVWTGDMTTPRAGHASTLLQDGRVLITGGNIQVDRNSVSDLESAEIYDPSTGTFSLTGSMHVARESHSATLLLDGRVLIAGGQQYNAPRRNFTSIASAELYDPVTGTFISTGNMVQAQSGHTATLLNNGKVLITGGSVANVGIQPDSEIYDPATGVFSRISLDSGYSKATPLFDGRILIADGTSTPHLYDPTTDAVEPLGFLTRAVGSHTMSLLPTGKVLIAGGYAADNYLEIALDHAELFDPASGAFQKTASLSYARYGHTATLLSNGLLLIAGGIDYSVVTTAELFDPYTETFQTTGRMNSVHGYHSATLLRNGTVLFSGGIDASAELYIPPERPSISFDRVLVRSGESFNTTLSGLSPSDNSFYDLRFHAPGDSTEYVALNWQLGRSAAHNVATGMATGTWTVTGVRPHQDIDDHTGDFASVSVELLVTK